MDSSWSLAPALFIPCVLATLVSITALFKMKSLALGQTKLAAIALALIIIPMLTRRYSLCMATTGIAACYGEFLSAWPRVVAQDKLVGLDAIAFPVSFGLALATEALLSVKITTAQEPRRIFRAALYFIPILGFISLLFWLGGTIILAVLWLILALIRLFFFIKDRKNIKAAAR